MVPAGMENLISAPLVKKLDKEEEQVMPSSAPSELRGRTWGGGTRHSDSCPVTFARISSCSASASGSSALHPCRAA